MECVMETLTKVIPSNVSALNKNKFLKRLNKFLLLSEATLLCATGCHSGVSEETSKDDTSWSELVNIYDFSFDINNYDMLESYAKHLQQLTYKLHSKELLPLGDIINALNYFNYSNLDNKEFITDDEEFYRALEVAGKLASYYDLEMLVTNPNDYYISFNALQSILGNIDFEIPSTLFRDDSIRYDVLLRHYSSLINTDAEISPVEDRMNAAYIYDRVVNYVMDGIYHIETHPILSQEENNHFDQIFLLSSIYNHELNNIKVVANEYYERLEKEVSKRYNGLLASSSIVATQKYHEELVAMGDEAMFALIKMYENHELIHPELALGLIGEISKYPKPNEISLELYFSQLKTIYLGRPNPYAVADHIKDFESEDNKYFKYLIENSKNRVYEYVKKQGSIK